MSALTSAKSPAASPRASGYSPYRVHNRAPNFAANPIPSPDTASNTVSRQGSGPVAPSVPQAIPAEAIGHHYVDVGTQYSPEGYPPTAGGYTGPGTRTRAKRKQETDSGPSPKTAISMAIDQMPVAPQRESASEKEPVEEDSRDDEMATEEDDGQAAATTRHGTSAAEVLKRPRTDSKGYKIMPRQYETCDPMDLGILIADMLMELIRLNDKIPIKDGKLTRFHSRAPPGISTHDYLRRLIQHATLSPPILLSMVFYIDKLCNMYPAFTIGSLTVHRFLITAATVASKGLSDSFWTNPTYARIGGISTSELATLELDFLERVDFKIVPKPETLVDYYNSLVRRSQDYRLEGDTGDGSIDTSPDSDAMEAEPT